jgi:pyruvate-formate lyase-activating enzyme
VPAATLAALGVEKVVFSGGEPALHPELDRILRHYAAHVAGREIITNGLLMDGATRAHLLAAGATAFTFSIDSVDPERFEANRGLPGPSLARILEHLREAAEGRRFGLGVNAVVTTATATVDSVHALLAFAAGLRLDFVRFSPVFDDGYVGRNAPHLRLREADADALDAIAELVRAGTPVPSNTAGFWRDLAALARGERLQGTACGLGDGTALLVPGRLVRCYWIASADVGPAACVTASDAQRSVRALEVVKPSCKVDARCFCLQTMEHEWTSPSTL